MKNFALIIIVALIFVFTPAKNTFAATYYVSPNGTGSACSDTSPCSQATGYGKLASGDNLFFKSGVYKQTGRFSISKSGVTIATAPNQPTRAVITGDTDGDGDSDAPAKYQGLIDLNSTGITIRNLEITYAFSSGIQSSRGNNIIEGNVIRRASDRNFCGGGAGRGCTGDWEAGIAYGTVANTQSPGAAPNMVIRDNIVFNTSGEGIICMHSDGGLIENNTVFDNWAINIYLDQCANTIVKNNLVYYTDDKVWWRFSGSPAVNIAFADEGISNYPAGHDRKFINNIAVGGADNFAYWNGNVPNSGMNNDIVAFNTFVEGSGGGIDINRGSKQSNSQIVNNIVVQTLGAPVTLGSSTGITFANNLWSKQPSVTGVNDIVGNPLLFDDKHAIAPGMVSADWYKLTSGSPAINKAKSISGITADFFGNSRGSSPDIGAHEFGTTGNPPSPSASGGKAGDANNDSNVDGVDYVIWLNNYNKSATGASNGDFNGNGIVDGIDYVIWLNNYGK